MSSSPWPAASAALAAISLAASAAGAEPRAIRVEYEAHEGCPPAGELLEQVLARTSRARAAAPDEPAMDVWVRITRRGPSSVGRVVLWRDGGTRAREVQSDRCDDVVSALALITALAVDPGAAVSPRPAPASPPPASPDRPPTPPQVPSIPPAPDPWSMPAAVIRIPVRFPAPPPIPVPAAPPKSWILGAHLSTTFEVTPQPLFGGGLDAELSWSSASGNAGVSLRVALDLATTGTFDIGPGGVTFLRGITRLDGCPFMRPASQFALAACLGAEVGFLRGEGLLRGTLTTVQEATVPWAGLGLAPRVALDLGERGVLDLQGGPSFSLVRRSFVFERPPFTIHEVPAVTWAVRLGVGVRF